MKKRLWLETAGLVAVFAVVFAASALGITSYVIIAVVATIFLWGIFSFGRHIMLELGKGHWAALVYGPLVLLVIVWFGVMAVSLWFHPIGWPP